MIQRSCSAAALLVAPCLLAAGCSSDHVSRQLDVPFETANAKLHELYPSVLSFRPVVAGDQRMVPAGIAGPRASVRRDEMMPGVVTILVSEGEDRVQRRTEIVLKQVDASHSEVSLQTSNAPGAALLANRDKAYEAARLDEIVGAMK